MKAIEIRDLSFGYSETPVLRNCNLTIEEGAFALILGGNGSGKSTLLKLILGELTPKTGKVMVLGKPIEEYTSYLEIGYVPQLNVVNSIAFPITSLELVALNLYEDFGVVKIPRKGHYQRARKLLAQMGMGDYGDRPVNELSGGLRQRVMICRAMINNPKLLILDEPTAGVDKENKGLFINLLKDLNERRGITVVMVTHELKEIEDQVNITDSYLIEEGVIKKC